MEVDFVLNLAFEKKSDDVIKCMINKSIKEKLVQSDLEKCSFAWIAFNNI